MCELIPGRFLKMSESRKEFIKCYIVIFSLFIITVTPSQHQFRNEHHSNRPTALKDSEEWVWGYEEIPEPKTTILKPFTRRQTDLRGQYGRRKVSGSIGDLFLRILPNMYVKISLENLRESEEWIWGYVDPEPTTPSAPTTTNYENIKKLCSPYNPPKPNFNAKGRRISEAKCYEYIWELKTRHKQHLKSLKCNLELNKNADPSAQKYVEIIRGREAEPGEFPHMGAIGWQASSGGWVFKCGSSLISSKFVLTAGHCSRASDRDTSIADPVPKIIRLGDKNIIDVYTNGVAPTDARIINIIVHPKYHPPKKYYDIALMELEDHVAFSKYIQPACLWTRFDTSVLGKEATLTGWGVVETIGRTTSPELQAAVVDIIDSATCERLLKPSCNRNWCGVRDNQICAGKLAGGVDACQGDSGGPLQVQIPLPISSEGGMHYVVGVTSFGIGCALPNLPGIYSRVAMYLDWIESIVWPTL